MEPSRGKRPLVVPKNAKIVAFGDSRMAKVNNTSGTSLGPDGWGIWAQCMGGNRFTFAPNLGIGGQTAAQILARVASAIASPADLVAWTAGVNGGSETLANRYDDYHATLSQLIAGGKSVLALSELPNTVTGSSANIQLAMHNYLANIGNRYPGIAMADVFSSMADPATACSYRTGYSDDGLHPNPRIGFRAMAQAMLDGYLTAAFAGFPCLAPLPVDTAHGEANTNPLLTGTAGTKSAGGATVSGTVATSWAMQGSNAAGLTVVCLAGDDTGGASNSNGLRIQKFTVSGTPTQSAPIARLTQSMGAGTLAAMTPGTVWRGVGRIAIAPGFSGTLIPSVNITIFIGASPSNLSVVSTLQAADANGFDYAIMTPDIAIPAGTTVSSCQLQVNIPGIQSTDMNVEVDISHLSMRQAA